MDGGWVTMARQLRRSKLEDSIPFIHFSVAYIEYLYSTSVENMIII